MVSCLNGGATALMVSIGHQTGLFDTMAALPPSTSEQIAAAADLNERYVREWLGAMVTSRIVEHDPVADTYVLPPEHAASLTRAAGADNIAVEFQFISLLAEVEQRILECFRNGGGVPYTEFVRFHRVMADGSATVHDQALLEQILPLAPRVVERLESGIDVLDIGCGSGHAVNLMAEAFPRSRFRAYDISEEGIGRGCAEAEQRSLRNVRLTVQDVASMDATAAYDLVTAFDAIHDQAQPARVLENVYRALRPGGAFFMVDIAASSCLDENIEHPLAPFLYTVSCMHCMTVSLAYNGVGLGTVWGEQRARDMLREAGFDSVQVKRIDSDILNNYYVCEKKPA
jgi:2-polyprenyl-3-methyl-5-hydroxy-6-metoxy-1,4-benzoquinol methylase